MRLLVTGAGGQLGVELRKVFVEHELLAADRLTMDITRRDSVMDTIREFRPEVVIHAAAQTNVDGCELNPDDAYTVNGLGTQNVALASAAVGASLVYVSTDYVFDGRKDEPYLEFDDPCPISVYGRSKLAGERFVQMAMDKFYIVRTAWLYGVGKNFVKTMISLADSRGEVFGVTDEIGSPTYARDLAEAIGNLIQYPVYGIYHLVNEGNCSRYEFIKAICQSANRPINIIPLTSAEFLARNPLPAKRPASCGLRNFCASTSFGIRMRPWREALDAFITNEGLRRSQQC